jgi:hypothetical protein
LQGIWESGLAVDKGIFFECYTTVFGKIVVILQTENNTDIDKK